MAELFEKLNIWRSLIRIFRYKVPTETPDGDAEVMPNLAKGALGTRSQKNAP